MTPEQLHQRVMSSVEDIWIGRSRESAKRMAEEARTAMGTLSLPRDAVEFRRRLKVIRECRKAFVMRCGRQPSKEELKDALVHW